ncbi:hypothetical protein [Vibrio gigantis]|uniref:hypothetical protein n=1 Tax=Vibrio gigantis TaxID=296199 RepID=UPI0035A5883C
MRILLMLIVLFSAPSFAEDQRITKAKAMCETIKLIAEDYASFRLANQEPTDSINYKDPIKHVIQPFLSQYAEDGVSPWLAALGAQAAVDGEGIYETAKEKPNLTSVTIVAQETACYFREGVTLEEIKALKGK